MKYILNMKILRQNDTHSVCLNIGAKNLNSNLLPAPVNICLWLRYHHIGRRRVSRQWLGDVRWAHDEWFREVCHCKLAPRHIVTPFAGSAGTSGALDLSLQLVASLAIK